MGKPVGVWGELVQLPAAACTAPPPGRAVLPAALLPGTLMAIPGQLCPSAAGRDLPGPGRCRTLFPRFLG